VLVSHLKEFGRYSPLPHRSTPTHHFLIPERMLSGKNDQRKESEKPYSEHVKNEVVGVMSWRRGGGFMQKTKLMERWLGKLWLVI